VICYFLFSGKHGIEWMVVRSFVFIVFFFAGTYYLNLTPDLKIVMENLKKKFRKNN